MTINMKNMKWTDAIKLYLSNAGNVESKSKTNTLNLVKRFPVSKKFIMKLNRMDLSDHGGLRKVYLSKIRFWSYLTSYDPAWTFADP